MIKLVISTYLHPFNSRPPSTVLHMDGILIMQPLDIQVTSDNTLACLYLTLLLLDQIRITNHRSAEKNWTVILVSKGKPCIATIHYYEIYLKKKKCIQIFLKQSLNIPGNPSEDDDFGIDPSETEKVRALLWSLAEILPERFKSEESKDLPAHTKQFAKTKNNAILILKPRLQGTWFIPSNKESEIDSIGSWPVDTKFPSENAPLKAPKDTFKPPRGISDYVYDNPAIKRFMDAPVLHYPNLDHSVFQNPSKPINFKKTIHPAINKCISKSLHEGYVGEELTEIALELCSFIENDLDPSNTHFQCLKTLLMLIGHSFARDSLIKTNIHVINTLAIRDKIFESFILVPRTKNILRGTGFLSNEPFGPLPESLKESLKSFNAKEIIAKAIPSTTKRNYYKSNFTENKSKFARVNSYSKPYSNLHNNAYSNPFLRNPVTSQDQNYKGKQNFFRNRGFSQKNPRTKKPGN